VVGPVSEDDEQHQGEHRRRALRRFVRNAVSVRRNQFFTQGEFDGQPEQQDGGQVAPGEPPAQRAACVNQSSWRG
jgi:hypothetical protein